MITTKNDGGQSGKVDAVKSDEAKGAGAPDPFLTTLNNIGEKKDQVRDVPSRQRADAATLKSGKGTKHDGAKKGHAPGDGGQASDLYAMTKAVAVSQVSITGSPVDPALAGQPDSANASGALPGHDVLGGGNSIAYQELFTRGGKLVPSVSDGKLSDGSKLSVGLQGQGDSEPSGIKGVGLVSADARDVKASAQIAAGGSTADVISQTDGGLAELQRAVRGQTGSGSAKTLILNKDGRTAEVTTEIAVALEKQWASGQVAASQNAVGKSAPAASMDLNRLQFEIKQANLQGAILGHGRDEHGQTPSLPKTDVAHTLDPGQLASEKTFMETQGVRIAGLGKADGLPAGAAANPQIGRDYPLSPLDGGISVLAGEATYVSSPGSASRANTEAGQGEGRQSAQDSDKRHESTPTGNLDTTNADAFANAFGEGVVVTPGQPTVFAASGSFQTVNAEGFAGNAAQIILQQAAINGSGGTSSVQLTLTPEHLGKIELSVTTDKDGKLFVQLTASSGQAQSLLQNNLSNLRDELQKSGFTGVSIDVRTNQGSPDQSRERQQRNTTRAVVAPTKTLADSGLTAAYLDARQSDGFFAEA